MHNTDFHSLKVKQSRMGAGNCKIELDDFALKGVTDYEIKASAPGRVELSLKLIVSDLELAVD